MTQLAERLDTYATEFEKFRLDPMFGKAGLRGARESAFERFTTRGFPTTRDEEWKFTNVGPIAAAPLVRPAAVNLDPAVLAPYLFDAAATVVMLNGVYAPHASSVERLPKGITVSHVRGGGAAPRLLPASANPFVDLNTAFFDDAVVIEVEPKTVLRDPIHVLVVSSVATGAALIAPRISIHAGERSEVSIVESYVDLDGGVVLNAAVTDVHADPGAIVDHVKLQRQGATAFHVATMFVQLERQAQVRSHSIAVGGRIVRNDVNAVLGGEGAECTLNGLYVAGGDSLVDNHTMIDHARAHCPSHEVYKGILTGRARAVFNGKIVVRPDAQKTNAKQTNKALLLTDDAQINTKPQLEIFADDVKCTHGAAIGQLDEDAMFYLQARGISAIDARNLLIHAFAGDVLDGVTVTAVRETAMRLVEDALSLEHTS